MKRIESNKTVALNYYIGANLVALVPAVLIGVVIGRYTTGPWQYIILEVLLFAPVIYFSFKWSGKNTNKGFVVTDQKSIANWAIGYLLFFTGIVLILSFARFGYISASLIASVLNTLVAGVIIFVLTPKFISITPVDEVERIKQEISNNPKVKQSVGKQILRTAVLTIGGFILLLIAPFVLYFTLTASAHLQNKAALVIVVLWELVIILLAKKFVFKSQD